MLTRDDIQTGKYAAELVAEGRGDEPWSQSRIDASMRDTLKDIEGSDFVWVFAYGSLIWNPLLNYVSCRKAALTGWSRRFCIKLESGRGNRSQPGRMLGLIRGGSTIGLAYRLSPQTLQEDLAVLWVREMIHGLYRPGWSTVRLDGGDTVRALIFVAETEHRNFLSNWSIEVAAEQISTASGSLGSNADYVRMLDSSLRRHDIEDPYIQAIATALVSRCFSS